MRPLAWMGLLGAFLFVLSGCGKGSSGDATAKLQFAKSGRLFSAASLLEPRVAGTPDEFKLKMIAAYLAVDIDPVTQNNIGGTTMIWLNPICGTDIMHCNTDNTSHGGLAEDGKPWVGVVTDFFDFSDPTAANTALNAQGRSIQSGTYKYARLEFCKYFDSNSSPNFLWKATSDGVATEHGFARPQCTVNSQQFATPLVIPSGGSATITLSYNLAGTVVSGGTGTNCSGGKCFNPPTFVPTASTP